MGLFAGRVAPFSMKWLSHQCVAFCYKASVPGLRIHKMQVGDLVKLKSPTTRDFNKVFLVTEWRGDWLKVLGQTLCAPVWQRIADFEVINESR